MCFKLYPHKSSSKDMIFFEPMQEFYYNKLKKIQKIYLCFCLYVNQRSDTGR